ncbi:MAG: hypothetical protein AAF591_15220 [Verrucomicrobiota bacterium]
MRIRSYSPRCSGRGYTVLIVVNLLVLVLVVALGAAYYFYRLSAGKAADEYGKGDQHERSGEYALAEESYREAVRMDPLNTHYKRRLHQLEFRREQEATAAARIGGGEAPPASFVERTEQGDARERDARLGESDVVEGEDIDMRDEERKAASQEAEELVSLPVDGPRAVSAALWPEGSLRSDGVEREEEDKGEMAGGKAEAVEAAMVETEAAEGEAAMPRVRLRINVPEGVAYRIEVVDAGGKDEGEIMRDWGEDGGEFEVDWEPGRYAIFAKAGTLTPWRQVFEITGVGGTGEVEEIELAFALLKILGEPAALDVHYGAKAKRMGSTPYTLVRPPSDLSVTLKAKGYEDKELDLKLVGGEVAEIRPQLEKAAKTEAKPEPASIVAEVVEDRPAEPGRPKIGESFMNGGRTVFAFRSKSSRGDPYWRSEKAVLSGMSAVEAASYCRSLNEEEWRAGRVPSGYAYFPSLSGDGRLVLARDYSGAERVARAEVLDAPVEGGVVVRAAEPIGAATGVARTGVDFGDPFTNGVGMAMEYREADYRGNPFWRSAGAVLAGMGDEQSARYLWELTARERAAGRVPSGYVYAKEMGDTGRYVLVRSDTTSVRVLRGE